MTNSSRSNAAPELAQRDSDNSEFARYLASFLKEHEDVFAYGDYAGDGYVAEEVLYKLIKQFMETFP